MNNLKIVEEKVNENVYYSKKWNVKNGRKKFAVIYKKPDCYTVTINGFLWFKTSLTDCIDHCNEFAGNLFFNKVIFCKLPTEKVN